MGARKCTWKGPNGQRRSLRTSGRWEYCDQHVAEAIHLMKLATAGEVPKRLLIKLALAAAAGFGAGAYDGVEDAMMRMVRIATDNEPGTGGPIYDEPVPSRARARKKSANKKSANKKSANKKSANKKSANKKSANKKSARR
jgi:hypothetical protein